MSLMLHACGSRGFVASSTVYCLHMWRLHACPHDGSGGAHRSCDLPVHRDPQAEQAILVYKAFSDGALLDPSSRGVNGEAKVYNDLTCSVATRCPLYFPRPGAFWRAKLTEFKEKTKVLH